MSELTDQTKAHSGQFTAMQAQMVPLMQEVSQMKGIPMQLQGLQTEVQNVRVQMHQLQQQPTGGATSGQKMMGIIPLKEMIPKSLNKVESWRKWRADLVEYLEAARPGLKQIAEVILQKTGSNDEIQLDSHDPLMNARHI